MKRYTFVSPGENNKPIEYTYTEDEIIKEYWNYWSSRMKKANKDHLISRKNCIEDWTIVNWAYEVKSE